MYYVNTSNKLYIFFLYGQYGTTILVSTSGIGVVALLYLSANQAASACFRGKNALVALSVVTSCVGVGGIFYPYLLQYLIDSYGVRGALLIVSAITMNAIPLSLLWVRKEEDLLEEECNSENPSATRQSSIDVELTVQNSQILSVMKQTPSHSESGIFEKTRALSSQPNEQFVCKNQSTGSWSEPQMMQIATVEVEVKKYSPLGGIAEAYDDEMGDDDVFVSRQLMTIKNNLKATFTNKAFLFLLFGLCFAFSSQNMFEILLLDILESCDLQRSQSVILLMVLNGACIPGRLSSGLIVKIPGCLAVMAAILGSVVAFIATVMLLFCVGFAGTQFYVIRQ